MQVFLEYRNAKHFSQIIHTNKHFQANIMKQNITLEKDHINSAIGFAKAFWEAEKSARDHGSGNYRESESDKLADTISGKLAEIAFSIFAKREFGISIELDFSITEGKLAIDNGQDIAMINGKIPSLKTDIKGSKNYAKWLLIEQHKVDENLIIADYYVSVSLNLPKDIEMNWHFFEIQNEIKANIDGYLHKNKFFSPSGKPWFKYYQGERLYSIEYIEYAVNRWKPVRKKIELSTMLSEEHIFTGYTRMGGPLKAKHNIGYPKKYLKSTADDFRLLFNTLAEKEGK